MLSVNTEYEIFKDPKIYINIFLQYLISITKKIVKTNRKINVFLMIQHFRVPNII